MQPGVAYPSHRAEAIAPRTDRYLRPSLLRTDTHHPNPATPTTSGQPQQHQERRQCHRRRGLATESGRAQTVTEQDSRQNLNAHDISLVFRVCTGLSPSHCKLFRQLDGLMDSEPAPTGHEKAPREPGRTMALARPQGSGHPQAVIPHASPCPQPVSCNATNTRRSGNPRQRERPGTAGTRYSLRP